MTDQQNTVTITRTFDAHQSAVWDAFTKQELLDQWWASKPYSSHTKRMDFRAVGCRFYAMVSPDGKTRMWHLQEHTSINPITAFAFFSVFADENEKRQLPGSQWNLNFREEDGLTIVSISIFNESLEQMDAMIEIGFKDGFEMTLK